MFVLPETTTGSERRLLEAMLDRNRRAVVDTARGLSETDVRKRLVTSLTTPIGLVKHAAMAERRWFQLLVLGLDASECDGSTTPGDASFVVAESETLADVIAEFERASARSREIAAGFDLDDTWPHDVLGEVNLRFVYLLLIEDFARHAGHGDILREQLVPTPPQGK
ncbi:DinB family protein [Amycolatopsis sp. MtRt-6]|uniref:DinB family protein n=1 Tax=Amycolatopsis sp. MtRt-6 TaxID=2792782 RepID=UPI001A8F828A|nr:DinB family protein [Amycolatopsis sp. MtRt-6]